jgi:hypothetical protein
MAIVRPTLVQWSPWGHGIVEFPLMAILVFGFATMVDFDVV